MTDQQSDSGDEVMLYERGVNPAVIYDMARMLADDVIHFVENHADPEWDGGDIGYEVGAMTSLAVRLRDALPPEHYKHAFKADQDSPS